MSQYAARLFLAVLLLAWFGLLFASTTTRDYAVYSFLGGDSAYSFYDDFQQLPDKPFYLFQLPALGALGLLYRVGAENDWVRTHRGWTRLWFALGAILICTWWSGILIVVSALFLVVYPWKDESLSGPITGWVVLALAAVSSVLRFEKLPNVLSMPLQPDAEQYVALAQRMTWFYDTTHREPLLAWIVWFLSFLFPIPDNLAETGYLPVRIATILLSSGIPVAMFLFGKKYGAHQPAFLAALLFAINKAFIYRSLQGLRLELLILGMLIVLWLALTFASNRASYGSTSIWLGIGSGLLLLVRTACLPFVVFLYIWIGYVNGRAWRNIVVSGILCLTIASPYYLYCWNEYGDPMYSGSYHLNKFYYMTVLRTDAPDTSNLPTVSLGELMLVKYPWHRSAAFILEGVADTLWGRFALRLFFVPFSVVFIGCSLVGYGLWTRDSIKRWWILVLVLLLGPMAFVLAMMNHSTVTFDWRTVAHLFPFMAYAASEGLLFVLAQAGLITRYFLKGPPTVA